MCPKDEDIAKLHVKTETLQKYDDSDRDLREVLEFVRRFQIQPGDTPIEAMRIYLMYKHSKDPRTFKINDTMFFKKFSRFFKKKRRRNGYVYFLNKEPFNLTQDGYWDYRKKLRNEKERKRKNKKN